jgi:hypothetical protein
MGFILLILGVAIINCLFAKKIKNRFPFLSKNYKGNLNHMHLKNWITDPAYFYLKGNIYHRRNYD